MYDWAMLSAPWSWPIVAVLAAAPIFVQSPEELLRRSDVGAFAPASFRARLVLNNPSRRESHRIEVWRSGDSKTLIRFLDPKERGRYLLRLQSDLWLLTPGAKKPVRLSPSYRLYGGATLDEVLGVRLAQEYTVESTSREVDSGGALVALELRAKSDHILYPQVRYVVREATERPVTATYRVRSGRVATAVEFVSWSEGTPVHASRVVVKDLLRKGALTEVDVTEMDARPVPDALFDLGDSTARRALDAAVPAVP